MFRILGFDKRGVGIGVRLEAAGGLHERDVQWARGVLSNMLLNTAVHWWGDILLLHNSNGFLDVDNGYTLI